MEEIQNTCIMVKPDEIQRGLVLYDLFWHHVWLWKAYSITLQRYGDGAGQATNEGLDGVGHAIGTAWTVFKIRKALNPKSALKPASLAKAAARATVESRKKK